MLAQVRAVLADIRVDAVKVGMLASTEIIAAVAQAIDELTPGTPVVVDPVMVSESGARLLAPEARAALISEILPRASVLTPNLPEARVLAGEEQSGREGAIVPEGREEEAGEAERLLATVLALGPRAVVLTGGHRVRAEDLYLDSAAGSEVVAILAERHPGGASHGSGCTHSAVLAAQLALGRTRREAAVIACALAGEAVGRGLRDVGAGAGPVDVIGLAAMRGA